MPISLKEAMKLNGIENWTLTPSQQRFLIRSTEEMLQNHPKERFQQKQTKNVLQASLKQVFKLKKYNKNISK